ncbi:hypothetical protein D9M68_754950 [compost metagenome]
MPYTSERLSVACARAAVPLRVTSLSRLDITKALRAGIARLASVSGSGGGASNRTKPRASVIFSTTTGATFQPPLATVA